MKKGDILKFKIDKYAFEGKGITRISKEEGDENNYVVFVNGAYPGDEVEARLAKIKKSFAEAKTLNVITKSEDRIEPRCSYFGVCGGCKQQDLSYEKQLFYKQLQVKEIFERLGNFSDYEMLPIIPSEEIFYYRNKMEFSFADKRWLRPDEISDEEIIDRNFALGLHIPRIFDKVLDIHECFLQSETSNKILNFTRDFFKSKITSIYSTKTHEGFLRNLVIKESKHTKDLMVNLVTSSENEELIKNYAEQIIKEIPSITTVVNNINLRKASVATGDYEKVFYGDGFITDKIGKYNFRISPNSFFQTNTLQAVKLYQTAVEFGSFSEDEVLYDLYSGAGTISLFVSEFVKSVIGIEVVSSAVEDAKNNSKLNNVKNVRFKTADLYKSFLPLVNEKNLPKPDVMIVDPPRSGMHQNTVNDILELEPKRIVYVSCNPSTQVRDITLLSEKYNLIKMQPVDMFPQTFHIENVALLILK